MNKIIALIALGLFVGGCASNGQPAAPVAPTQAVALSSVCMLANGQPAFVQVFMGGSDQMTVTYIDSKGNLILVPYYRPLLKGTWIQSDITTIAGATCQAANR